MKGQWREIQIKYQFNSKITRLKCMKDGYQMRTGLEAEGGVCGFAPGFFFLLHQSEGILRLGMCDCVIS